ncbi:MAG: tetratricopeptide repeat protein [Bacteroidota bacterium]
MRPLLVLLALCLCAAEASSQTPQPSSDTLQQASPPVPPKRTAFSQRRAVETAPRRTTFLLAQRLLQNGQTDEAIGILEDLLDLDPSSVPVATKLAEAYVTSRRWDDALALYDSREQVSGPSVLLMAERGAILHRSGQTEAARETWTRALELAPTEEQTYRTVSNVIGELRLYAIAAEILEAGRTALGTDDAFLLERANLYGLNLQYAEAIELYITLVEQNPEYAAGVRARLVRLLDGEGAPEAFASAIEQAQTRDPLNRAFRELAAWLAMERKDYVAALNAYRAIDRLEQEQGESLVAFAESALADDAVDPAASALDEVLDRHPDGPSAPRALLLRGQIARDLSLNVGERADRGPTPHADAALATLGTFLERYPNAPERAEAQLMLARVQQDVMRDFDGAEALLMEAATARRSEVFGTARLGLGEVAIRRGDLNTARDRYQEVEDEIRIGPIAEQARYELARLDFYEGYVYSALARAEAIDENTAADVTNDAIALRVTLDENAGPDTLNTPLLAFGKVSLLSRRGLADSTLAGLAQLEADYPMHPLTDEILYLRAQNYRDLRRPEEAATALDRLAERVPLSFYRDRALMLLAEIAEHDLNDLPAAAAHYDRLLELVPGSLFAPQARANLRRLRAIS